MTYNKFNVEQLEEILNTLTEEKPREFSFMTGKKGAENMLIQTKIQGYKYYNEEYNEEDIKKEVEALNLPEGAYRFKNGLMEYLG